MSARRAASLLIAALLGLPGCTGSCRRLGAPLVGPLRDLLTAAEAGDVARVRRLLESDPGLARAGWEGSPSGPVGAAAEHGHLEVVRLLLDAGADARERDVLTHTPLHRAKTPEVAALLLEHGVSPEVRTNEGETPLMSRAGQPDVAQKLLEAGARTDRRDRDGVTALHRAVNTSGRNAITGAALLCAYGADPGQKDDNGKTPADLARQFLAEGLGSGDQNRVMVEWLSPGGGCDTLRARFARSGPASLDERNAALYEAFCRNGDLLGCNHLGSAYENGLGVPKDAVRAAASYRKSCEGANAWGCYAYGYSIREGAGVPADPKRAAELFEQSCTNGYGPACGQLAWHLLQGRGVGKDDVRAGTLFTKACDADDEWSCWQLSKAYAEGRGVARDPARAAALREKACAKGEKRACGDS